MKKFGIQFLVLLASVDAFLLGPKLWACGSKPLLAEDPAIQEKLLHQSEDFSLLGNPIEKNRLSKRKSLLSRYYKDHLSPPWWVIQSELINSIGQAPGVIVGEPAVNLPQGRVQIKDLPPGALDRIKNPLISIEVQANSAPRAYALAFVLKPQYQVGGTPIRVWVSDPANPGLPIPSAPPAPQIDLVSFVMQNLQLALDGNPYFLGFTPKIHSPLSPSFFMVFNREEVQFFADNIGDAYRNINAVAEDVFGDVLNLQYFGGIVQVGVSTIERGVQMLEAGDRAVPIPI